MESILNTEKDTCYLCGRWCAHPDKHHVFHGRKHRQLADREGLFVYLCPECHTIGPRAVHRVREIDLKLQQEAQEVWEKRYRDLVDPDGDARLEFMKIFGKNYIYD